MKQILEDLFDQKRLSREEARDAIVLISEGAINETQIASFLTVFKMRPVTKEELHGFRDALLQLCIAVDLEGRDTIDLVGTGGDGKHTFNISTLSGFIVAGAGYPVVKHGNYGVSSVSGASNVLETFGYSFTSDPDILKKRLDHNNLVFLHAPLFHPAMKIVGPVRKALGLKTFFNMLGPLVNPARPYRHFLGVYDMNLSRLYQYILQEEGKPFSVIHNLDGYDEISLTGDFILRSNDLDLCLKPEDLQMEKIHPGELSGGKTIEKAAAIFKRIISGEGTQAQNDVVCANAGLAIQRFHPERSFVDCIEEAKESLYQGKASSCFRKTLEYQFDK